MSVDVFFAGYYLIMSRWDHLWFAFFPVMSNPGSWVFPHNFYALIHEPTLWHAFGQSPEQLYPWPGKATTPVRSTPYVVVYILCRLFLYASYTGIFPSAEMPIRHRCVVLLRHYTNQIHWTRCRRTVRNTTGPPWSVAGPPAGPPTDANSINSNLASCESEYIFMSHMFLPRDAMKARYMLSLCVRPSHAGIVPKQLNVRSRKQRHTMAQGH